MFFRSGTTGVNGVVEDGVRYDKGSFVGTDAAWFFDRADHAKTITDWFSLGESLHSVSTGVLANVGNGGTMTTSAKVTSTVSSEIIEEAEKRAAKIAEKEAARQAAAKANQAARGEIAHTIPKEQKKLLQELFGAGVKGAKEGLERLKKGSGLPEGLSRETLEGYRQVAKMTIEAGSDKIGTQVERLKVIEEALKQLK